MKKKFLRCLSLLLVIATISSFSACFSSKTATGIQARKYKENAFSSNFTESGTAYENEYWELLWDDETKQVNFKDKRTGCVWGQIPTEAMRGEKYSNISNAFKSAIIVYFYFANYLVEKKSFAFSDAVRDGMVYANQIENGLRVTYDFCELKFSVTVDYIVSGKMFSTVLDPRRITDNGTNFVTGVSVLPFICGVENTSKTDWLFMPDGSGSVIRPKNIDAMGIEGIAKIYGDDLAVQKYEYEAVRQQVLMPVYGVVKKDHGLFCIISSGAEQSSITWQMGSSEVGFSSIYPMFRIRGYSLIETPNGFGWTSQTYIKKFDEYNVNAVFKADYYSLSGEKASLNGMAEVYKEHLKNTYDMKKTSQDGAVADFKIIGGMRQSSFVLGVPSEELFCLTSTKQAEEIITDVTESVGNDITVRLMGFGESGMDPGKVGGGFKVASKFGGNRGLSQFTKSLEKRKITPYFDFDIVSLGESGAGYSPSDSGALLPDGEKAYFELFDFSSRSKLPGQYGILSRSLLKDASQQILGAKEKMNLKNISLASLSNTIYSDYVSNSYRVCKNMVKDVTKIIGSMQRADLGVAGSYANDYAAATLDFISDCPMSSSDYVFSYASVPFYQMVFRGDKVLSSSAINLTSDEKRSLLFCVESGMIPSYTLIANFEKELATSQKSFIYGSVYDGIKDGIKADVAQISEYLKSIRGAAITDYEAADQFVRMTKFDNGVVAVVNYGNKEVRTPYGTVPAESWITGRE